MATIFTLRAEIDDAFGKLFEKLSKINGQK